MVITEDLQAYLKYFGWSKKDFTPSALKSLLVLSIAEFLEGRNSLEFVFNLGRALQNQKEIPLDEEMRKATATLDALSKQQSTGATDREIEEQLAPLLDRLTHLDSSK